MLTPNPWRTESRVIREANALSEMGFSVQVICDGGGSVLQVEKSGPVTFFGLPKPSFIGQMGLLLRAHEIHTSILARGFAQSATRGKTLGFLCFYLVKAILAIVLLPFIVVLQLGLRGAPEMRSKIGVPIMRATGLEATLQMNQFSARAEALLRELSPDVVHAHDLATLPAAFVRASNWKVVYDAHELETQTNTLAREPFRRRWVEIYEAVLAPACDAVITVSQSIAEWLRDTYRIAEPTVIYNAPETAQIRNDAGKTLRGKLQLSSVTPLAVYVGSVTLGRGIEQCVEMLAHMRELHLALVGARHKPVEEHARASAARMGAIDRLHFVDPVPPADVTSFISDADCSLVTVQNTCLSYHFSFPNKLLESVFAGVPIVGARLKELSRFLADFPVGVIADETDPQALATAVGAIIHDRKRYAPTLEQLGKIEAIFGWAAQKRKLGELYSAMFAARD